MLISIREGRKTVPKICGTYGKSCENSCVNCIICPYLSLYHWLQPSTNSLCPCENCGMPHLFAISTSCTSSSFFAPPYIATMQMPCKKISIARGCRLRTSSFCDYQQQLKGQVSRQPPLRKRCITKNLIQPGRLTLIKTWMSGSVPSCQ